MSSSVVLKEDNNNNNSAARLPGIVAVGCQKALTVVIEQCRYFFHIELPSVQLQRRFENFFANAADDDKVY